MRCHSREQDRLVVGNEIQTQVEDHKLTETSTVDHTNQHQAPEEEPLQAPALGTFMQLSKSISRFVSEEQMVNAGARLVKK